MFCKHNWKLLSSETTESSFEHAMRLMKERGATGKATIPWQMCDTKRKLIQVFSCDKCGKIKRYVEVI